MWSYRYGTTVHRCWSVIVSISSWHSWNDCLLLRCETGFPAELNQGEARRGAIARALMLDPEVLLLDDPVAGLDAEMVLTLKAYVEERQVEQALTVIAALRSFSPFIEKADRLILLRDGRVEADGPRAALTEVVAPTLREYLG